MSTQYYYSDIDDHTHEHTHRVPRTHPPTRRSNLRPPMSYAAPGAEAERIGAYVAQHLVPAMLARQDQPVQLVLNFGGALHLAPGAAAAEQGFPTRGRMTAGLPGPGPEPGLGSGMGMGGIGLGLPSMGSDLGSGSRPRRTVGYCRGCCRRQLVGPAGNCRDCDDLATAERRGPGAGGWEDGIRYVAGRDPWVRRDPRNVSRGARQYQGYWSDSEVGGYSSGRW